MARRYEKMREEISDFEKIRIINEQAVVSKNKEVRDLWTKFSQHLKLFAEEKDFNTQKIKADVDKGGAMIEQLMDKLSSYNE
jgi:hypothetical protein